jgi:hypothetical protein
LNVILLFGLLLRAEKDKRMRLHNDESFFDEEMPHPGPLRAGEREQRTKPDEAIFIDNLLVL